MSGSDVLVVDDDDGMRRFLCDLLALEGFSVDEAGDGATAWDRITGSDYRVVLLDVQLPALNGLDVLTRCGERPQPPKVIVMTGLDTTATVLGALRGRAYDFLPKPVDASRLLAMIRRAIDSGNEAGTFEVVSARPEWVELLAPCTREAADRIQSFVQQLDTDLPDDVRETVGLVFRELLLNGIEWGGRLDPAQKVRVACLRTGRMRLYRIADPGPGFTFEGLSHAAMGRRGDAIAHDAVREDQGLRPGGFGLVLIRALADELIYNERQNEVIFVKYLDSQADGHELKEL